MDYRKKCEQRSRRHYAALMKKKDREDDLPCFTLAEMCTFPDPKHGDTWGNWRYDARTLELIYVPRNYGFDLEDINILGRIFHVCAKTWMSKEDAGNLIFALADLIYGEWANEKVQAEGLQRLRENRQRRRAA